MANKFIIPILLVTGISMCAWLIFWKLFVTLKRKRGVSVSVQAEITIFLFYIYIILVLSLTIIPLPFARFKTTNGDGINITPVLNTVKDLLQILSTRPEHETVFIAHSAQNVIGNIILFMPLGIFLPLLSKKYYSAVNVFLLAFVCSVSIELTQLLLRQFEIYRSVDIDDVILNTSGAMLGFLIINKFYFHRDDVY